MKAESNADKILTFVCVEAFKPLQILRSLWQCKNDQHHSRLKLRSNEMKQKHAVKR